MSSLVLYQKQIEHGEYAPAKVVTVFPMNGIALEEALKQVRYNFKAYALSFKELPPEKLLVKACEEAIRAGRGQLLPLANKPKDYGYPKALTVVVRPAKHG